MIAIFFILAIVLVKTKYNFTEERLDDLINEATNQEYLFNNTMNNLLFISKNRSVDVRLDMPPMKGLESIKRKLRNEKNYDLQEIHDILRCSLIFQKIENIYQSIEDLSMIKDYNITKIDDKFKSESPFKNININIEYINSKIFLNDEGEYFKLQIEIQFHVCSIYVAKNLEQPIYSIKRLHFHEDNLLFNSDLEYAVNNFFSSEVSKIYKIETELFKKRYYSYISCEILKESYCQLILSEGLRILDQIILDLYKYYWNQYLNTSTCIL